MTTINPAIFRGYDIRGIVGADLNPETVTVIAKAYATFLIRRQIRHCVIGRDMRESSEGFQNIFMEVLLASGINVFDIGLTLTQIMYFAQYHYLSKGGVMITASHNPREFNGMKLAVGFSDTLISSEIQELLQIAQSGEFTSWGVPGAYEKDDVFPLYKEELLSWTNLKNVKMKVVVDSLNGTTGKFLPDIFRSIGCEVIEAHTAIDPSFPLGTPDPTERRVMEMLSKEVQDAQADLGFTFDSDGDRVGIVDASGQILWNDVLVAMFASDILHSLPGAPIVFNVLCSKATSDVIVAEGGKPVMWKVGHSFIKEKVKEERAPFGGELSGHFFFMDNFFGHDDGAFSSIRLVSYLVRTNQTLSQALSKIPKYVSSPEIKLGLADAIKLQYVKDHFSADVKSLLPHATSIEIDGFRADTKDEMVVIRASQNGPYITIKFEGRTQEQYDHLKVGIATFLKKYPEIKWNEGVNTDAFN